jgi:hypothetical protein
MSDDNRYNICDDCGGYMSTVNLFAPPPPQPRSRRDDPFSGLVTMGVVFEPLRCAHCEWDDRLLPDTPAEAGLDSLRRLFRKELIDNAEFLARERAMLLELLGIDSLEVVPETIKSEIAAHIASRRSGTPGHHTDADTVPGFGWFHGVLSAAQVIEGFDVETGLVTIPVDLRRVIELFGADAPGPVTAMWIRLARMNEAAERRRLFTIDPADIWNQALDEDSDGEEADDDD